MLLTAAVATATLLASTACTAADDLSSNPPAEEASVSNATRDLLSARTIDAARSALDAGADIEARGDGGATPLIAATKRNDVDLARMLIGAGADVNAKDDIQDSAYLYAGARGHDDILVLTLENGADLTSTNRFGGTALIPASERGLLSTVLILLEAGVDPDHVNDLGWTALHEAIVLGDGSQVYVEVVRALIDGGADVTIADGDGATPRELALARGYDAIAAELDR